jgi:hypothetical protein
MKLLKLVELSMRQLTKVFKLIKGANLGFLYFYMLKSLDEDN